MIQIIDYGAGNIRSLTNALSKLGEKYEVISSSDELKDDAKVILPGVGAAGAAMKRLAGLDFARIRRPFLGICLGMQLLLDFSEEGSEEGDVKCAGIFKGRVKKFRGQVKVPQVGWNKVEIRRESPLFQNIPDDSYFYFVNSYFADCDNPVAVSEYGQCFPAAIQKNNFYGVQFHPEKSGETGLKLLNNFCKLC